MTSKEILKRRTLCLKWQASLSRTSTWIVKENGTESEKSSATNRQIS